MRLSGLSNLWAMLKFRTSERKRPFKRLRVLRRAWEFGGRVVNPVTLATIAKDRERMAALSKGKMVFYIGRGKARRRTVLDVWARGARLIMPFEFSGKLYSARYDPFDKCIKVFERTEFTEEALEPEQFVSAAPNDMGHLIMNKFGATGIPLLLTVLAKEHAIAENGSAIARNVFLKRLLKTFQLAGYRVTGKRAIDEETMEKINRAGENVRLIGGDYGKAGVMSHSYDLVAEDKSFDHNNLEKFHRFVSYDPKNKEIKSYYYPLLKK